MYMWEVKQVRLDSHKKKKQRQKGNKFKVQIKVFF